MNGGLIGLKNNIEMIEVTRVEGSAGSSATENQWRLQGIVSSNIEVVRNVMQMHSHVREMMFTIVSEVLRRGLKGQ